MNNRRRTIIQLAVLLISGLVIGGSLVIAIDDEGRPKVTVNIGHGQKVQFDEDNTLQKDEQKEEGSDTQGVQGTKSLDAHEDLRDETPPGVPKKSTDRGLKQKSAPGKGEAVELGGAQNYNCSRQFVRNSSSRNGQKVLLFVLHYTVSPFGSINGIYRQFNTPASGTSSSLGLELTGQCRQWVPFGLKPWTQGNFNGRSESVEIVAPGDISRQAWLNSAIFKKGILASIVYDRLRANGLPIRLVNPDGCGVQAAGYTDHNRLECGNNHTDVGKNFPFDALNAQLRILSLGRPVGGGKAPPSEQAIRYCKTWMRVRRLNRPPDPPRPSQGQRELASKARRKLGNKYRCGERNHRVFIERR